MEVVDDVISKHDSILKAPLETKPKPETPTAKSA